MASPVPVTLKLDGYEDWEVSWCDRDEAPCDQNTQQWKLKLQDSIEAFQDYIRDVGEDHSIERASRKRKIEDDQSFLQKYGLQDFDFGRPLTFEPMTTAMTGGLITAEVSTEDDRSKRIKTEEAAEALKGDDM